MKKFLLPIITLAIALLCIGSNVRATSITSIKGTDTINSSRAVLNANFEALNNGKLEANATTSANLLSLPNLFSVGTISSGTWNSSISSSTVSNGMSINGDGTIKNALILNSVPFISQGTNDTFWLGTSSPSINAANIFNNFSSKEGLLLQKFGTGNGDFMDVQTATGTSFFSILNSGETKLKIGNNPTRPLTNSSALYLYVGPTRTYKTIQSALNVVPYILQNNVRIYVDPGDYSSEDIIIWPSFGQHLHTGSTEIVPFQLTGSTTNPSLVKVGSILVSGLQGDYFGIHGFTIEHNNPYDNEDAVIAIYGSREVGLGNLNFSGGTNGIDCYNSNCSIEENNNFGNSLLTGNAFKAKQFGIIKMDPGYTNNASGTVQGFAYEAQESGEINFNSSLTPNFSGKLGLFSTNHQGKIFDIYTKTDYSLESVNSPSGFLKLTKDGTNIATGTDSQISSDYLALESLLWNGSSQVKNSWTIQAEASLTSNERSDLYFRYKGIPAFHITTGASGPISTFFDKQGGVNMSQSGTTTPTNFWTITNISQHNGTFSNIASVNAYSTTTGMLLFTNRVNNATTPQTDFSVLLSNGGEKTEKFRINSNGYVGILNNNPQYTLDVNGNINGTFIGSFNNASSTNWQNFYSTPSNRISAGTGLSWSGNTLNSPWTISGNNIYNNNSGIISIGGLATSTAGSISQDPSKFTTYIAPIGTAISTSTQKSSGILAFEMSAFHDDGSTNEHKIGWTMQSIAGTTYDRGDLYFKYNGVTALKMTSSAGNPASFVWNNSGGVQSAFSNTSTTLPPNYFLAQNTNSTLNNYEGIGFQNQGGMTVGGLFCKNISHSSSVGSASCGIWTANGGTATKKLDIGANGYVGIGTSSSATVALDVTGTIRQSTVKSCSLGLTTDANGAITGCVVSDESLKNNIGEFNNYEVIKNLNPVTYTWKDDRDNGKIHAGFVAQQVEKVLPEAVVPAGTNLKGVDSNAILAAVVKFIQNLDSKFQDLLAQVSGLEEKFNTQQDEINQLRKDLNRLNKKCSN